MDLSSWHILVNTLYINDNKSCLSAAVSVEMKENVHFLNYFSKTCFLLKTYLAKLLAQKHLGFKWIQVWFCSIFLTLMGTINMEIWLRPHPFLPAADSNLPICSGSTLLFNSTLKYQGNLLRHLCTKEQFGKIGGEYKLFPLSQNNRFPLYQLESGLCHISLIQQLFH